MTREEAIERVRACAVKALRDFAAYTAKADQPRGYSRADKVRFRYLAGEYANDAAALQQLLKEVEGKKP